MLTKNLFNMIIGLFLLNLITLFLPHQVTAQKEKDIVVTGNFTPYFANDRVVIKFKTELDKSRVRVADGTVITSIKSIDDLNKRHQVNKITALFPGSESLIQASELGLPRVYRLQFPSNQVIQEIVAAYAQDPHVEWAQPVGVHKVYGTIPNDSYFSRQWGMTKIKAPEAWDIVHGDTSIILAIIDTGVDWLHPDLGENSPYLKGNIWTNWTEQHGITGVDDDNNGYADDIRGWDWVDVTYSVWPGEDGTIEDNNPMDFNGHGTHCAGIASAITNNSTGVAGLGWACKIMPLRAGWSEDYLGSEVGFVAMDFCAQAIYYAARNGAVAINCSWGSSNTGGIADALDFATTMNVMVVTAAGNDDVSDASYLASRHDCIAVAATDPDDKKTSYSSYGYWVDVSAPGGDSPPTTDMIYSTYYDHQTNTHTYEWLDGTSMAAPHVVGLIGLIHGQFPGLNWRDIKERLQFTSDNIDLLNPGYKNGLLGEGRINAFAAVSPISLSAMVTFFSESFNLGLPSAWTADPSWRDDDPANRNTFYDDTFAPGTIRVGYDVWNPPFMIVDSDFEGNVAIDAGLISPIIDCSRFYNIRLVFNNWFQNYYQGNIEKGDIDIRINNGLWQTVANFTDNGISTVVDAGREIMIRLPVTVNYQKNVQIRWHYYNALDEFFWGIDDVKLIGNMIATDYYVQLFPSFQTFSGLAGDTVTYLKKVKNLGSLSDSYDLSVSGNLWITTLWDSAGINPIGNTGLLASGQEFDMMIKTEIPSGAVKGAADTAHIMAVSTSDTSVFAEATVLTIVKAPPDTIPWFDDFPTMNLDTTKWTYNKGPAEISTMGLNPPSPPYSLNLNGDATGGDEIQSRELDLSGASRVVLSYWYERTGDGESPDSGDDLYIDYLNSAGNWVNLKQYLGADPDMTTFEPDQVLLPADAYHRDFRIRFRNSASKGSYDDWFIDDVELGRGPDIYVIPKPEPFDFKVDLGDSGKGTIIIRNKGASDLRFSISHTFSTEALASSFNQTNFFDLWKKRDSKKTSNYDANARTTEGFYIAPNHIPNTGILTAGKVLKSWPAPSPIISAWGVGFDKANIWISDADGLEDYKITTEGIRLSSFSCASWVGSWPADMAWDGAYLWQVNVGGDNGIYQLDPATGAVVNSIHDPNATWDAISQRGLAYDPDTDTFYIGGWNQDMVYCIKGLSWAKPGEIIRSFPFINISGLGWHPAGTLWIATNEVVDMIYQVDPRDGTVLSQFAAPGAGDGYWGAGLEVDNDGNLWVVCQDNNIVYLVDSGVAVTTWLDEFPRTGKVAPGDSSNVTVTLYTTDKAGVIPDSTYKAIIHVFSNDPDTTKNPFDVKVAMTVNPVDYYFRVSPTSQKASGKAGDTLSYQVSIKNYGQVTDSYNLGVSANLWYTTFWDSTETRQITNTGPVTSKTRINFVVKVAVPGTTKYGDTDSAKVQIASAGKPVLAKQVEIVSFSVGTPDTIPWLDNFSERTLDPHKWIYNGGSAEVNDLGINEPSPFYSLNLNGDATGGDEVRSTLIDLSKDTLVVVSYYWERTGEGDSPESGDNLWVDYLNYSGSWINLTEHLGEGIDDTTYTREEIRLPADAYHNAFQLRFRSRGSTGSLPDDWFVDNVTISRPPVISVTPDRYEEIVISGESAEAKSPLIIGNAGEGILRYHILSIPSSGPSTNLLFEPATRDYPDEYYSLETEEQGMDSRIGVSVINNAGGPDKFGYYWLDSDEQGGPDFKWIDIATIGTKIAVTGDDANVGFFPIGFSFPFYGRSFTLFRFCINGFITFSSISSSSYNEPLPNQTVVALIAPFWDDLYFDSNSSAYYHFDGEKLIVQYNNVPRDYYMSERNTFEILLYPDGTIIFQYLTMQSSSNTATIGIQNSDGSIGLEIAFNINYVHNRLAVYLATGVSWIKFGRTSGTLTQHESDTIRVIFTAKDMDVDSLLYAKINIRSNDPVDSIVVIPAKLSVITNQLISGKILSHGNPLAGAVAQVWDQYPQGSIMNQDTTEGDGKYLLLVPPEGGIFTVRAYAHGYYPGFKEDVPGNIINLNFNLHPVEQIIPTTEWVDFFSDNSKFWGGPVQIGDVITAEDPDSVICGTFTVRKPNYYGFMPVYKDDNTTAIDEGAQPGDTIIFKINGYSALTLGPDSPVWTSHGSIRHVDLTVEEIDTVKIPLATGWNLVSWNVIPYADSLHIILSEILSKVLVVLSYEKGGLTYDPRHPEFSNLKKMDHLHGYWIKMLATDTLLVVGNPVDYNLSPIACESGWNLVSYLPFDADSAGHSLADIINGVVRVYGFKNGAFTYDPKKPQYNTLPILCPTFGYWINLTQDDTLIYPDPIAGVICPYMNSMLFNFADITNQSKGSLSPTNEWINIFGAGIRLDGEFLPIGTRIAARDPQGIICGEFVVTTPGEFGFMPIYKDDPNTTIDEGADPGDAIAIYFNDFEIPVTVNWKRFGDIVDLGAMITSVVGELRNLPTEYNLAHNYPNPFNPETTIKYQLPKPGYVSLKIYNMLGQLVRDLVAEEEKAGYYTISWDGRDSKGMVVANGIYLYQLKAGNYENTKKMLMLK